jgi:hypothetical protein
MVIVIGTNEPDTVAKHVIKDYSYDGSGYAIWCDPTIQGIVFDLGDAIIKTTNYLGAFHLKGCTANLETVAIYQEAAQDFKRVFNLQGNAVVNARDVAMHFDINPQNHCWVVGYAFTGNVFNLLASRVIAGASHWDAIVYSPGGGSTALSALYEIDADVASISTDALDSGVTDSGIARMVTVNKGATASSNYRQVAVSANFGIATNGCSAPIVVRSYVTTTAGLHVTSFVAGAFIGQKLIFANDPNSTQNITLDATATNVALVSDTDVAPKSGFEFVWNGSRWVGTSTSVAVTGTVPITSHHALIVSGGDGSDDHTQYHNDARAVTWLATKSITGHSDVPSYASAALKYLRANAAHSALEWANPVDVSPPVADTLKIVQSTYATDSSGMKAATESVYPVTGDADNVGIRIFAGTTQARFVEYINKAKKILYDAKEVASGKFESRIRDATGAVKHFFGSDFIVAGADSSFRTGTEVLSVNGDIYIGGNIITDDTPGSYTDPYLVGVIRMWDDGAGKLRAKSGSDPSNATDGTVLF